MRAASIGVSEKLTNSDTVIANAMVRPKLWKKRPTMPLMNATGRNTASSESVVASTASPMSLVANTAATNGFCFFSCTKRVMFSSTTIASSITMPTASASASSVIMFSVKPIAHISANVPMIEIGIASAAMNVLRALPRNTSTISAAKSAPKTKCSLTAFKLVRMTCELSRTTFSLVPGGRLFSIIAKRSRMASTTATVFWPDCLRIESTTVACPSSEAYDASSSAPSSTVATSSRRVG